MKEQQRVERACEDFFGKDIWAKFGKTAKDRGRRNIASAIAAYLGDDVVVPREPTAAMTEAFSDCGSFKRGYSAMLSALPKTDANVPDDTETGEG